MPLLETWKKVGAKVLTPNGPGKIGNQIRRGEIKVVLDYPVAGAEEWFCGRGEIALNTDFAVIRAINLDHIGLVTSAATYPAWEDAIEEVKNHPYSQDETWQAINLNTGQVWSNRILEPQRDHDYYITEASFDRHIKAEYVAFTRRGEAIASWEDKMGRLSGTSGHLLLSFFLGFEHDDWRLLAYGLYSTMEVIRRKNFYEKKR